MANENNPEEPTALDKKIIRQVEYYFGDLNLGRDKFLQEKIKEDHGWVALDVLLTFNRLKQLSDDSAVIAAALTKSATGLLEVSEDKTKIRRCPDKPLPEFNKERKDDLKGRTLYAKGFPLDTTLDNLMEFFEGAGPVEQVKMRKDIEGKYKGSCFVVYEKADSAKQFLEADDYSKYKDNELQRLLKDDYFKLKTDGKKALKEEELKHKEERQKKRQEQEAQDFQKRITLGAILRVNGIPDDINRDALKAFFANHGTVAWADYDKGDKQGMLRFDCVNGATAALEKAKAASEGKVMLNDSELECTVLEGDDEITHWKNIFQSRKDLQLRKRQGHDKQRRKANFSKKPHMRRKRQSGGRGDDSDGDSGNEESEPPAKVAKVDAAEAD